MELLFFILGMAVGVAAIYIWLTAKSDGTLRIDSSDPDGAIYVLGGQAQAPRTSERNRSSSCV